MGYITPVDGSEDVKFYGDNLAGASPAQIFEGATVEYELRRRARKPTTYRFSLIGVADSKSNRNLESYKRTSDEYVFLNPYNFVRYLARPDIDENTTNEQQLLWRCLPPPHDRYVGLSGQITCEIENVTPLFVSDSHAMHKGEKNHYGYRFFEYDGKLALPASSLRGMIRSIFETVTNSCMGVFDEGRLDLREGRLPKDLVPARVLEVNENGAKLELLDCSEGYPGSVKRYWRKGSPVDLMKAASVSAYEERVLDTREDPPIPFDPTRNKILQGIQDGDRVAALIALQLVNNKLYEYFNVVEVAPLSRHNKLHEYKGVKKVFGYAHITGPNIERKHLERIFFRWDDNTSPEPANWQDLSKQVREEVDVKSVQEYNQHLAEYWARNRSQIQKLNDKGDTWPIDAESLPHPSTFIQEERRLREGDLVYYIPRSKAGFALLRPVLLPRLPYKYSRADLLSGQKHLEHCTALDNLCPACRTFGWVHPDPPEDSPEIVTAYAGRVRFSHAHHLSDEGTLDITPLAILSTPKPTTTQFYLFNEKGEPDAKVDYNTPNAQLRGRKVYRHQGEANPTEYTYQGKEPSDQNRTVRNALKPGAKFEFTVDFENLMPVELGALLYALELEEGLVHRLGYAKPLGFGSIKVHVASFKTLDWVARLASIKADAGWPQGETTLDIRQRIDQLKANFLTQVRILYGVDSFDSVLADLRALLGPPPENIPIHYPRPQENLDIENHPQFEWFVGNKRRVENYPKKIEYPPVVLPKADKDREGLPLIGADGKPVS
jgi:CRISPR-associated protein (TIGR03986 family)